MNDPTHAHTAELATTPEQPRGLQIEVTVQDLKRRKVAIDELMREVLVKDTHFGASFPGDKKQNLLQPGADALIGLFGLSPRFSQQREDFTVEGEGPHREYTVTCTLYSRSGVELGSAMGSCTTLESKYRWRNDKRKCPQCGKDTIIKGKAEYGGGWLCFTKKDGCGAKWPEGAVEIEGQVVGKVPNPDIADVFNTVLKIAMKRAKVAATILVTGCADMFTQDVEDMKENAGEVAPAAAAAAKPPPAPGRPANGGAYAPAPTAPPVQAAPAAAPAVQGTADEVNAATKAKADAGAALKALEGAAGKPFAERAWKSITIAPGTALAEATKLMDQRTRLMRDAKEAIDIVVGNGAEDQVREITSNTGMSMAIAVNALKRLAGLPSIGSDNDPDSPPF
jgi:hypothetical protein